MNRTLGLLVLFLAACADTTPASIRTDAKLTISDNKLISPKAEALNAAGEPIEGATVTVTSVSDPKILKLGNNGELQCAAFGTATATLTSGSARFDQVVECMLVKEIRAVPATLEALLVRDEAGLIQPAQVGPFQFEVVGLDDAVIPGVNLTITASDPNLLEPSPDGRITVKARGKSSIKAVLGDKIGTLDVLVAEELATRKGVLVEDSKSFGLPLEPGSYRVTAGSDQGVKISFDGQRSGEEAGCTSPEGTTHDLQCTFAQTGTLLVENPGVLGIGGGSASVNLRVIRLP